MDIVSAIPILKALQLGERRVIYITQDSIEVSATRTDRLSTGDFAVGLHIPRREEFFPTHVRLLIDLHLKTISEPQAAQQIFAVMEKVFDGEDPVPFTPSLLELKFPMQLDRADVNVLYAQLLMIEQDFNYGPGKRRTTFDPPRGFLMAFIRWVASGEDQIDRIITAAVRNYPPPNRFRSR